METQSVEIRLLPGALLFRIYVAQSWFCIDLHFFQTFSLVVNTCSEAIPEQEWLFGTTNPFSWFMLFGNKLETYTFTIHALCNQLSISNYGAKCGSCNRKVTKPKQSKTKQSKSSNGYIENKKNKTVWLRGEFGVSLQEFSDKDSDY